MNTKYIFISLIFLFALSVTSCDLLEEDPEHILVTSNFYSNSGDAVAAVNTIYNRLYSRVYERDMQLMADLPTDDYKNGQGMNNPSLIDLEFLQMNSQNQFVEHTWQDHYDGINRANAAIIRIPEINIEEGLKNRLLGESRFLRALFYFNLVRFFGDVPLVTIDTRELGDLNVSRTPVDQVYGLIIEDLTFAENNLPPMYPASEIGRATQGAAKALLGKVYLTRQDWSNAVAKFGEIVNNEGTYGYGLLENYRGNWLQETENGPESVFSIQMMEAPGNGNILMRSACPRSRVPGLTGWEADIPTVELYEFFDENDERRDATFFTSFEVEGTVHEFPWPLFYKYFDPGKFNNTTQSNANIHVIRYADVLLMYAEAINELNGPTAEAFDAINRVRSRAFNGEDFNYSGLTQEELRQAIYDERRLEFPFEAHRWFDLVRTGRFVEVMTNHRENGGTQIAPHKVLMPIPQRELDINLNLTQNPGY